MKPFKPEHVLFLVLAFLALVAVVLSWPHIRNELFVLVGSRDSTGGWYGTWSGFGGALPDIALVTAACGWYLQHSCHDHPTCLRWGKYEAAGGLFRLCRKHHPDMDGHRPDREMIHRLHQAHKERITAK
jgi:hypothetical protein